MSRLDTLLFKTDELMPRIENEDCVPTDFCSRKNNPYIGRTPIFECESSRCREDECRFFDLNGQYNFIRELRSLLRNLKGDTNEGNN